MHYDSLSAVLNPEADSISATVSLAQPEPLHVPTGTSDVCQVFVEELERANSQKKQRIEQQMAARAAGGPSPFSSPALGPTAAPSDPSALTTTLSGPMAGLSADGARSLTEDEELEAAIR
jgi:hypothetical protein